MRVLVVGDILRDTIAEVDHNAVDLACRVNTRDCEICFDYGSKIAVENQQRFSGGNAANVAAGLARLGVMSELVSAVGDDDTGNWLLTELAQKGVSVKQVIKTKGVPTSNAFIVRYLGERTIFSYHAPHTLTVTPTEADVVYLTSAYTDLVDLDTRLRAVLPQAIRVFQPGTSQLALDQATLAPIMATTDLLIVNEDEAGRLLNERTHDLEPKQLLHALLDTKAKEVIITAGKRGSYVSDGHTFVHCSIIESAARKDTTGVGDAFAAAYVWSRFDQKFKLEEAAKAGTLNAASVIKQPGAQEGQLDSKELLSKVKAAQLTISEL